MTWTAPSAATLAGLRLDCQAADVRAIWKARTWRELEALAPAALDRCRTWHRPPTFREAKREALDLLAGFHGVETIGRDRRTGQRIYYLNAGDTYAPTLVMIGRRLLVACWGDLIESRRVLEDCSQ